MFSESRVVVKVEWFQLFNDLHHDRIKMTTQFNELSATSRSTLHITQVLQDGGIFGVGGGEVIGFTGVTTVRTDVMGRPTEMPTGTRDIINGALASLPSNARITAKQPYIVPRIPKGTIPQPPAGVPSYSYSYRVGVSRLDRLNHMNHSNYIGMSMLSWLPLFLHLK
jgi:hypothetical protein